MVSIFSILVLLSGVGFEGRASQAVDKPKLFVALLTLGPTWDSSKAPMAQAGFREHSQNLTRLRREKKIRIGARYGEFGMVVVEAQTEAEVRALFESDPMVRDRAFNLGVHPFDLFYAGCLE